MPGPDRRYLGLEGREWLIVALAGLAGIVTGLVVHYVESLATDVAYLADLLRAVIYVVAFVAFMIGIGQLSTGRRSVLLAVIPFVLASIVASWFGPAAVPAVVVEGRHELAVDGLAAEPGSAACTWAAGREKVERISGSGDLGETRPYTLDVDRGRLTVTLELDGGRYLALGSPAFEGLTGDASVAQLKLPLVQTLPEAPPSIPGAVEAAIAWTCEPAPSP